MRLLFLSDTHLGFDLPARPRSLRQRRGAEFFESFDAALAPARAGEVDAVLHAGDLLYRSRVPAWLSDAALAPLRAVADSGVPVLLLPGNHERGQLPHPLLALHRNLHLFDRPRTVVLEAGGVRVAFAGFPYQRDAGWSPIWSFAACGRGRRKFRSSADANTCPQEVSMLSKHIGWCGAVLMSLAQAPDSAALPPPSEISAPAATAKATKPADVQVKKFPGSPTQVTPARPSDAKSIVPKAKRLDERALRGLRLVMSGAVVDIRQLPLYFDSPQDVVDVMYTAVAVKAAGEAQRNAGFSKSKKQAALTNTVKVLKDGGLSHLDEAELLRMYNSLPEIGIKPAKLNAPKAKFSVREASYYSVSTRTTPGHIDWHGLGSFLTCQAPLAEGGSGFELGAGFTWWINVPYPCGIDFDWFNSSIEWCDYWVPIKVGVTLGCNCGFQVDCCGAAVWGECYGEACIGVCAGCSAGLALGAGGLSSSTDGSICAYGIPVVASASCQFAGITIWSDAINVSPYAVTGPCPVPGMCATP